MSRSHNSSRGSQPSVRLLKLESHYTGWVDCYTQESRKAIKRFEHKRNRLFGKQLVVKEIQEALLNDLLDHKEEEEMLHEMYDDFDYGFNFWEKEADLEEQYWGAYDAITEAIEAHEDYYDHGY